MKKLLLSVVLLLISSTFAHGQMVDKQDLRLTGPVRSVREEMARLENHSGRLNEGPRVLIQSITFDQQGNTTEDMAKNPDGSLRWKLAWERAYDNEGKETQRAHFNAEGALTSLGLYTYDGSGKKLKMTRYNPDGSVSFYQEYIYDELGRSKEEYDRTADGSPSAHLVYVYDDKGQQTERVHYNPDETLSARFSYTYDQYGNMASITETLGSGAVLYRETFNYDARGNLIKRVIYGSGKEGTKYIYSSYEFDRLGNWIKRKTVQKPVGHQKSEIEHTITYRTLTYY